MKSLAKFFLTNKALSWLMLILMLGGGIFAYNNMGKLEDAPFTIKQALVTTSYPGAKDMQQLWDKLRRKVNDVQNKLPAGAGPSVVNDDFGDVLGVFYGLSSETHTYRELEDCAKDIKNELLDVKDVAKVELFGIQNRTIEVTVNPSLLSQSGVMMSDISSAFERQNKVVDAGAIETSTNRLRIEATGSFTEYSKDHHLNVEFPQELLERIPGESREALIAVLADDPRPAYQNDPERSYGMPFGEKDIHFRVDGDILRVYNVTEFVKKQQESSADCGK